MQNAIAQRVKDFIDSKRWSVNSLSKQINIPQMTLNRQLTGVSAISVETISAILTTFPNLSAEWLMRGIGPMEMDLANIDSELNAVCVDQAKQIYQLKKLIADMENFQKDLRKFP